MNAKPFFLTIFVPLKRRSVALAVAVGLLLTVASIPLLGQEPVDLNSWVAESYPPLGGFPAAVWTVAGDGLSVFQSVNGQPTLFCSDFGAIGTSVQGQIRVETGGDDDFIGIALGFNPGDSTNSSADYLLVDWKQGTQSFAFDCTPESSAPSGLAVSRVSGIPTPDEFWGHKDFDTPACPLDGDGLTELARGTTLGSTGWVDNATNTFKLEFDATSLRVFVNGSPEMNVSGTFSDGRLCFYNFSQSSVRYSGFTVAHIESRDFPTCDIQMSQPIFTLGQRVIAESIRVVNNGNSQRVEFKNWIVWPDGATSPRYRSSGNGQFLKSGFDRDFGPRWLFTVRSHTPVGTYEFNCVGLDPVTSETLSLDQNSFEVQ